MSAPPGVTWLCCYLSAGDAQKEPGRPVLRSSFQTADPYGRTPRVSHFEIPPVFSSRCSAVSSLAEKRKILGFFRRSLLRLSALSRRVELSADSVVSQCCDLWISRFLDTRRVTDAREFWNPLDVETCIVRRPRKAKSSGVCVRAIS